MEAMENDPIVISVDINSSTVRRIITDDSSAVEIFFFDVYQKIGLKDRDLKPEKLIYGFGNNSIHLRGGITLPITIGIESPYPHLLRQFCSGRPSHAL